MYVHVHVQPVLEGHQFVRSASLYFSSSEAQWNCHEVRWPIVLVMEPNEALPKGVFGRDKRPYRHLL